MNYSQIIFKRDFFLYRVISVPQLHKSQCSLAKKSNRFLVSEFLKTQRLADKLSSRCERLSDTSPVKVSKCAVVIRWTYATSEPIAAARRVARCRLQGFTLGYASLWEAVWDRVQGSNPFTQGLRGTSCLTADKSRVAMGTLGLNSALGEDQRRAGDFITKVCSAKSSERVAVGGWVGSRAREIHPVIRVKKKKNSKSYIKRIFSIWYIFVKVWMNAPPAAAHTIKCVHVRIFSFYNFDCTALNGKQVNIIKRQRQAKIHRPKKCFCKHNNSAPWSDNNKK